MSHSGCASSTLPNARPRWARLAHDCVYGGSRRQFQVALERSAVGTGAQAMYRAMLALFEGDADEAIRRLRLALGRDLADEERAYVCDLLVDTLIDTERLAEAREVLDATPDHPDTRALIAAHHARIIAHAPSLRRQRASVNALRHAVLAQDDQLAPVVVYRLADAAYRSGDYTGATEYIQMFAPHRRRGEHERVTALLLDLQANMKLRTGYPDAAIKLANEAWVVAKRLDERTLMARHLATSLRAAAEAGNLAQYARDRHALAASGALVSIDPVWTATAEALRDLCLGRFQDVSAHLASIDDETIPPEIRRELAGYRALAALAHRQTASAREYAQTAVAPLRGSARSAADPRALRRARLLAGFVLFSTGSRGRGSRLLRSVDLMESPDAPIALGVLHDRLPSLAHKSGLARAMYAVARSAGSYVDLPARQLEVARLLASGLGAPEIAVDLGVTLATVKTQLQRLYRRLRVRRRADALRILESRSQLARLP